MKMIYLYIFVILFAAGGFATYFLRQDVVLSRNGDPVQLLPSASGNTDIPLYLLFNEDATTGNPKYRIGDSIILGDQCATRVRGNIQSIGKERFIIEINEKEGGDPFNPVFISQKPASLTVKTGTYLKSDKKITCTDIEPKGTEFFISEFTDKENQKFLNISQTLDAQGTMTKP